MPDDQPDLSPGDDERYGAHEGGGWISGPCNGGPDHDRGSFAAYLTDDGKGWVPVNRGRWQDDEPAEPE